MPRRSHRALVIGFLFLGFALRGSLATAQTTALYFDSQAGDFIGQGQELTYQQGSSMFQVSRNGGGGVTVSVKPPSGLAYWWNLDFSAPASAPLATGSYLAARRYPFTHFVGMSVSGSGHGCNTLTGQFDVLEVSYAPDGSVQRFAADFEQHCDDNVPALFGSVRYNSTIQSLTPFAGAYPDIRLLVTATAHGTVTGNAIACNDTLTDCEQVLTEAAGVALTAAADPGYELVAWTGDCVGGEVALVNVNGRKSCGAVFAPHSPPVARSALSFDSQTGDYIGQGERRRYAEANSNLTASSMSGGNFVHVHVDGADNTSWNLDLRAPGGGLLVPGDYPGATRASFSGLNAGLDFSGDGRGCNTDSGRFVVYESQFAGDGTLQAFAADFEQYCEGFAAALFGAIRYHSSVPSVMPFSGAYPAFRLTVVPQTHGRVTGSGLDCRATLFHCTLNMPSAMSVTLTAVPDAGYRLVGWSGGCSGSAPSITVTLAAVEKVCTPIFSNLQQLSLTADRSLPARFGQAIAFHVAASGAANVEYSFWRFDAAAGWIQVQPYGPSPAYTWTPGFADIGYHAVQVWARTTGALVPYEAWSSIESPVVAGAPPVVTSFQAGPWPMPMPAGVTEQWTAGVTAGATSPACQFWRNDADGWHIVQGYSSSCVYSWTPGVGDMGQHTLQVWVRNSDSAAAYETYAGVTFNVRGPDPLTGVNVATGGGTFTPGNPVIVTASGVGGVAPLQYQFWRRDPDGWHIVQDYGPASQYTWMPGRNDVGIRDFQVRVRSANSSATYDVYTNASVRILPPPPLTASSVQITGGTFVGRPATFTAVASGGVPPLQYQFWRLDADGWHMVRDYAPDPSYTWTPGGTDAGSHALQAWVRSSDSSAPYDAWAGTGEFVVSIPHIVEMLAFVQAPQLPAVATTSLQWTAASGMGSPMEYQYWRYDEGQGWSIVQPYGADGTYTWTTSGADVGTHAVQVWARRFGQSVAYEFWIGTGYFTILP